MSGNTEEALKVADSRKEEEVPKECAVCLQTCVHPVRLPCRHIFCFLCVKGVALQSKKCPMCRREIPSDYLDHPELLQQQEDSQLSARSGGNNISSSSSSAIGADSPSLLENDSVWYYEGRNGWWCYDDRTSSEMEAAYKKGDKSMELLIAGFLYVIDFENMFQARRNDSNRRRSIKRDLRTAPKKGIAGLRTLPSVNRPSSIATFLPPQQQQQHRDNDNDIANRLTHIQLNDVESSDVSNNDDDSTRQ